MRFCSFILSGRSDQRMGDILIAILEAVIAIADKTGKDDRRRT